MFAFVKCSNLVATVTDTHTHTQCFPAINVVLRYSVITNGIYRIVKILLEEEKEEILTLPSASVNKKKIMKKRHKKHIRKLVIFSSKQFSYLYLAFFRQESFMFDFIFIFSDFVYTLSLYITKWNYANAGLWE